MSNLNVGDVVYLKSNPKIKLTVVQLFSSDLLEAMFYNESKGEFQTIRGGRNAFEIVND